MFLERLYPKGESIDACFSISLETLKRNGTRIALHGPLAVRCKGVELAQHCCDALHVINTKQRWSATTKEDRRKGLSGIGGRPQTQFEEQGLNKSVDVLGRLDTVEVTVGALFLAKGDMEIESEHAGEDQ